MSNEALVQQQPARPPMALGSRGIVLTSMEDLWRFSQCVSKSGMAPKGMDRPESLLIAIEMGLEVGMAPMQSIQNIAVINGRPTIWGDAMLALCQNVPIFDHAAFSERLDGPGENMVAQCTVRRLPDGIPTTRTFTVQQAKRAKLGGKSGPWTEYPERMLQLRARSRALRDTFPDVLRGLYMTEEAIDTPVEPKQSITAQIIAQEPQRQIENIVEAMSEPASEQQAEPPKPEPTPEVIFEVNQDSEPPTEPTEADELASWIADLESLDTPETVQAASWSIPKAFSAESVKKAKAAVGKRLKAVQPNVHQ